ncbi:bifunctional diguanylate cyclase/phosphodiesterase [Kosakonia oryzendophytica]|uniref:bifunctional diguanylate cyclase/phosphodiesterase n=1 Tax=Kosakonia oryzendophytica TaxID=1005665 RepID=UPI0007770FAF|nr:EAL domain-containing protein [Kosakonia oryzendophytica]WBT57133.1 EAL domain-containing protein [Kosakonia oryzendophytica]
MSIADGKTPYPQTGNTHSIMKQTIILMVSLMSFIFLTILFALIQTENDLIQTTYKRDTHLLVKALENTQENIRLHLADNADWDEAYDNLHRQINTQWAWDEKNLGASLYTKFGYDGVFVISPTGTTPYSVVDGQLQTISLEQALGFNPINALKKELLANNGQAISHLVTRNGMPAILSAAWIISDDTDDVIRPTDRSLMVFMDTLTPAKLQRLGEEYGINQLTLATPGAKGKNKATINVGDTSLELQWNNKNPADTLLTWVLPLLVLLMTTSVLFAWSLARKALVRARMNDEKTFLLEQSRQALSTSERRFRDVVETTTDWIWEADEQLRLTWISTRFPVVTGNHIEEWLGRSFLDFLDGENSTLAAWLELPHPGHCLTLSQCGYVSALGNPRFCNLTLKRVLLADGSLGFRGTATDVTLEVETNARIQYLSHHDEITGLPNRLMMKEFLDGKLLSSNSQAGTLVMMSIDINDFKAINDMYGHAAGDKVLSEVSERLRKCVRSTDLVARQGGDEFIVILPDVENEQDIQMFCQRIIAEINQPLFIHGNDIHLGVSIGIAQLPKDALTAKDLLRYSDIALYKAKNAGKNNYVFYQPDMARQIVQRRELERELRVAINEGQLFLLYQPRYDLRSSRITSVEALVRWQHPGYGLLMPDLFIPLAEETGIIVDLTDWVLRKACEEVGQHFENMSVSVNISPVECRDPSMVSRVKNALQKAAFPASRLELELTENITLNGPDTTKSVMHELKSLGVKLLIDDFGTGYASLHYLNCFPFDGIKIDKSFVFGMNDSETAHKIVEKIIGLGKDYNLEVTAEGVETLEQLEQLKSYQCDIVQGYFISRPTTLEKIKLNANFSVENNLLATEKR